MCEYESVNGAPVIKITKFMSISVKFCLFFQKKAETKAVSVTWNVCQYLNIICRSTCHTRKNVYFGLTDICIFVGLADYKATYSHHYRFKPMDASEKPASCRSNIISSIFISLLGRL